jgi:hypothetical protein
MPQICDMRQDGFLLPLPKEGVLRIFFALRKSDGFGPSLNPRTNRAMDSSKQAKRAVIQFLSTEGVSGTDIHSRMKNVYGTEYIHSVTQFGGIHGTIVNCYLASVSVNNTLSLSGVYQISPDIHCHLPEKSQNSTAGNYGAPTSVPLSLGHALYIISA